MGPDFRIEAYGAIPLDPEVSSRVDQVWERQKRIRGSQLYDAPLLALESYDPGRLVGRWTPYRAYIALRSEPDLVGLDAFVPVGVSGLVVCGDSILFGRRSDAVTAYPGFIELLPSGSIDSTFYDPETLRVNYLKQLLRELQEEIGLAPSAVSSSETLGVVLETQDPCCDVVVRLDVPLSPHALQDLQLRHAGGEYREIHPVRLSELGEFSERWAHEMLPTTIAILEFMGWISGPDLRK